jgi:hypothetical protein
MSIHIYIYMKIEALGGLITKKNRDRGECVLRKEI